MSPELFSRWGDLLVQTGIVAGAAALVGGGLGTIGGWLIVRTDLPARRLLRALTLLLACLPLAATVTLLLAVVPLWSLPNSAWSAGALHGLFLAPLAVLLAAATFEQGDAQLEEAARLDASAWHVFRLVTLPQAAGGLFMTGLLVAFLAATELAIVDLLQVRTFAGVVYIQFALARRPTDPLLTAAPIFVILLALLVFGWGWLSRPSFRPGDGQPQALPRQQLGWAGPLIAVFVGLIGLAALGLIVAALARLLGTAGEMAGALRGIGPDLRVSATLGITATLLIVASAWPAARLAAAPGLAGRMVLAAALVLLALPAPVAGVGLILLLNQPGWLGRVYDSPAILVIGYLVRFWPVAVLLLTPAAHRLPRAMLETGRVDGCGAFGLEWHVALPLARPALLAVMLVTGILCLGEIGSTVLLAPPGWSPASVRAFTLMHFGVYRDLAVLALSLVVLTIVPWLGLLWLLSREQRSCA